MALLACPLGGCGLLLDFDPPDPQPVDAGPGMDGGAVDAQVNDAQVRDAAPDADHVDLGPMSPCFGLHDGADCGGTRIGPARVICVGGACIPSVCGDGFVDTTGGEECDPLGDPDCNPLTCRYECMHDSDCADVSGCVTPGCVSHRCTYTPDHGGSSCVSVTGVAGTCVAGLCVRTGCGDGMLDVGEDCDPGTRMSAGCHACVFDCHTNADCSDGNPCNGIELCASVVDPTTGVLGKECQPSVGGIACSTPPPCYVGGCIADAAGMPVCAMHLIDLDGDGFAAGSGCGGVGGDCNDMDPSVHPGAVETCNGVDDDCNGVIDDHTMTVTWCFDGDGDGFGDPAVTMTSCMPPPAPYVRDCTDCWDTATAARRSEAALVNPAQTGFFTTPYCPVSPTAGCSFDYNCDGAETLQIAATINCGALAPLLCSTGAGWQTSIPACGAMGTFETCHGVTILGLGLLCRAASASQTQACH